MTLDFRGKQGELFDEPFPVVREHLIGVTWTLRSECCSFPVGQFQDFMADLFRMRCLECFYCVGIITGEDRFNDLCL